MLQGTSRERACSSEAVACLQAGSEALSLGHNALDLQQHLLPRIQQPLLLVRGQRQVSLWHTPYHTSGMRPWSNCYVADMIVALPRQLQRYLRGINETCGWRQQQRNFHVGISEATTMVCHLTAGVEAA